MTYTKALYKAQKKYEKNNCYRIGLKFNRKTDADIIAAIEEEKNKQAFVKEAIRKKIRRLPDQAPAPESADSPDSPDSPDSLDFSPTWQY